MVPESVSLAVLAGNLVEVPTSHFRQPIAMMNNPPDKPDMQELMWT
jgi:hypothetical protein